MPYIVFLDKQEATQEILYGRRWYCVTWISDEELDNEQSFLAELTIRHNLRAIYEKYTYFDFKIACDDPESIYSKLKSIYANSIIHSDPILYVPEDTEFFVEGVPIVNLMQTTKDLITVSNTRMCDIL